MATQNQPPLDEIQYRRPDIIQWHVEQQGGQPMDENIIHRYISESPFFDHSTKNGLTIDQARTNIQAFQIVGNRRAFEDQLRKQKGNEYMIVGEPQQIPAGRAGEKNGMWVIRKQYRDRVQSADGRFEEALTTLGTYFIVGENVYQAPSVEDVVGNRLLSAATSLSKFFDTASDLPLFLPASGYSYLPHSSKPSGANAAASTSASPAQSREGSVAPAAGTTDTQSLRSGSLLADLPDSSQSHHGGTAANSQDTRLLMRSFQMALEFGDEYMDENPLIGEPGNFHFSQSTAVVKKRRADEEAAAAVATAKAREQQTASKVEKPPSPPAVMTESKAAKERRGSKMEKIKRKKSRPSYAPGTPGGSAPNSAIPATNATN